MTETQLYERLKELYIPVAYRVFKHETGSPCIVYYVDSKESHGADYSGNLVRKKSVTIELYTKIKDTELESRIEAILNTVDFTSDETVVNDNEILTTYNYEFMEVI